MTEFHGLTFLCAFADRAVLKITEEEFSGPPMDVRMLNTGSPLFGLLNFDVYKPMGGLLCL